MTRKLFTVSVIFSILIFPACNQKRIWVSTPAHQTLNSQSYELGLEPLQKDADFFNWFRLTVVNKTGKDMEIDWNRTRYIHNGKDAGLFVFAGVVPESVKNATIPGAVITAGSTFTRDIAPHKLIAFTPLREQSIDTEQNNLIAGLIPAGENGIFLVILQDGKSARSRVVVNIESREAQ